MFQPTRDIRELIGDLSQWYLRRSRDRFKNESEGDEALKTLKYVLYTLSCIMAPFTPFIAEGIYQEVKDGDDEESVHLASWPEVGKIDSEVIENMKITRDIVSAGLLCRAEAKLKVRQPLRSASINKELGESFKDLIKDELNVKEVAVSIEQKDQILLDTIITKELKDEGHAREIIRNIQDLRKIEKNSPNDVITLVVSCDERVKQIIEIHKDTITRTTKTKNIVFGENNGTEYIDGELRYKLSINK